ncbi:hypothetical protein [Mesorhizobium sp. KR1-2]|uniref:hypothetical protein n=1 Tax=Mesorhizobium sp. KR1-2 TaxID=3156609 RepID=UPI0032B614C8
MIPQAYLHSHTYHAMLDQLVSIAEDHAPGSPHDLRSLMIEALGEIGNVWPASAYTGEDTGPSILVTA